LVDKQEKAARIGSVAIPVFRRLGYHRTRMADIAQAAGIGKGTLYEYFRNKEEIFRFEFERYFVAFQSGAAAAMAEAGSPGSRLLSLIHFAVEHVTEWEQHCAVYVDYFGSGRGGEEGDFSLSNIYAEIEDIIRLLIEEGQASGEIDAELDPGATAELLVAVFEGVVLHGVFSERQRKAESLRATALKLVARGVFAESLPNRHAPKREGERFEKSR
jgi:AcrR family transcriptional regulator